MPPEIVITRTPETEAAYEYQAKRILDDYDRQSRDRWVDDPDVFLDYLIQYRTTLSRSTWRQYRAALVFYLSPYDHFSGLAQSIAKIKQDECRNPKKDGILRTAQRKAKALTPEDFKALVYELRRSSDHGPHAISWLYAGLFTGLRPIEWVGAQLIEAPGQPPLLKVRNAKNTNERSTGEFRTLNLGHFDPSEVNMVQAHVTLVQYYVAQGLYKKLKTDVSNTIRRSAARIWPGRELLPSLYTARHQLAANLKIAKMTRAEIAAVMGHASGETASTHYAQKKVGQIGVTPLPQASPEEMARVRHTDNPFLDSKGKKQKSAQVDHSASQ